MFSDKTKRMAKAMGVLPENLDRELDRAERERQRRDAFYQWGKDAQKNPNKGK